MILIKKFLDCRQCVWREYSLYDLYRKLSEFYKSIISKIKNQIKQYSLIKVSRHLVTQITWIRSNPSHFFNDLNRFLQNLVNIMIFHLWQFFCKIWLTFFVFFCMKSGYTGSFSTSNTTRILMTIIPDKSWLYC